MGLLVSLDSRSPLPALAIPYLYFLLIAALSLPQGWYRARIIILLAAYIFHLLNHTTGSRVSDYGMGCTVAQIFFKFADYVVLSNAEAEFSRNSLGDMTTYEGASELDQPKLANPSGMLSPWQAFVKKLRWALELSVTARGIGWSWQVKNVPSSTVSAPSWTKSDFHEVLSRHLMNFDLSNCIFVLKNIFRALGFVILIRIRAFILTSYPASMFHSSNVVVQSLLCFIYGSQIAFGLNMIYAMAAAITVSVGIYDICDWPPVFGNFTDAYTLRRFWGQSWHQMERRIVSKFGIFTARDVLHFPAGTFGSRYIQLYVAFFISGLIHWFGGVFACRKGLNEMQFFMAQAVAIMAEDAAIEIFRLVGCNETLPVWIRKGVGYTWVTTWLAYSLRLYVGKLAENNVWL
ncbi:hypothetical protein BP6252_13150 [Coleophoma cylindrospora]|uniref:Wax synthase domain-containing protein n=1 Tax=Coleophoma cylindrospora TaxID=1849047 RepID=A0A3D8QB11_9HELO|nr:hypothetical protein BP6252_13150 [Coleophoma cylindrospora]